MIGSHPFQEKLIYRLCLQLVAAFFLKNALESFASASGAPKDKGGGTGGIGFVTIRGAGGVFGIRPVLILGAIVLPHNFVSLP